MSDYIFLGYEILTSFIPFLMTFMFMTYDKKRNGIPIHKYQICIIFILCIYIIGVYHFTGIGTIYDVFLYKLEIKPEQINLIPFSHDVHITSYILNIVLFVPLGIFLPIVYKKMDKFKNIVGVGLGFTIFIELTQLLNYRISDIDDMIMNVFGTVIGFVIFKVLDKITRSKIRIKDSIIIEIIIYVVVITLGRFLFYNEMGFAKLLFGF